MDNSDIVRLVMASEVLLKFVKIISKEQREIKILDKVKSISFKI
jgi:hypothetical protein